MQNKLSKERNKATENIYKISLESDIYKKIVYNKQKNNIVENIPLKKIFETSSFSSPIITNDGFGTSYITWSFILELYPEAWIVGLKPTVIVTYIGDRYYTDTEPENENEHLYLIPNFYTFNYTIYKEDVGHDDLKRVTVSSLLLSYDEQVPEGMMAKCVLYGFNPRLYF